MKSIIFGGLTFLLISTTFSPAYSREVIVNNSKALSDISEVTNAIKPFEIAGLAYQGQLRNQGIPGYASLLQAYQTRQISAKDVVRSAVLANKLPSHFLNDQAYINAVRNSLDGFVRNNFIN
ncbi:hypothetical protein [Nostoc sp. FACHB-110]|uniref:hypothetical protein n=1 Tax=Nostoc sp. FACHB-110 TaxID=2692834 RepID=UPI001684CA96|nr:hypothetical protein [Nostoc sp. FACHB-110]MBD2438096.1 hypothetical protein [Nostoc sp. FACHB-110]